MANLATCLTISSFDAEDVAEIQGFIRANDGDVEAGVAAYAASLDGDLRGLADQVAAKTDPDLMLRGKTAEEMIELEELRQAEAAMMDIPVTSDAPNFGEMSFFEARQYVGPSGETLNYNGALNAMYEIGAQWAGGPVRQERKATILIGAPAAGKSSIAEQMIAPQQGAMIVDSDEFKKMVPEYQGGIGANAVHEESKVMSDVFLRDVVEAGFNIVIPKVGGNPAKLAKQIEGLKAKGYTVDIAYMEVERTEVMRRMVMRFFKTGRLIPPSYLLEQVDLISPTYESLKQMGVANGYVKFDNNNAFDEPAIVVEDTRPAGRSSQPQGREGGGRAGLVDEGQVQAAQDVTTLFQPAAPLQSQPLPVVGTGPGGRVLNGNLGQAFHDRHMDTYGRPLDPEDDADYEVILDSVIKDYEEQSAQPDNGEAWYSDDIATAVEVTTQIIPELADPTMRDLFLTIVALLSPQQKPKQNWENGVLAMQGYLATGGKNGGKIALLKPSGKQFGVKSHTTGLQLLQHQIDNLGLEAALEWVQTPTSGKAMAQVRKDSGLFTEKPTLAGYTPNELNLSDEEIGIYMMGPKVGDFRQNSVGVDQNAVTVDLWMARTYNRLIGRLMDVPPKQLADGKIASDVRGRGERLLIKRLVRDAAKATGLDPSAMQAALWYFEQRLYRNHGIKADSQNFSDAAYAAVSSRREPDAAGQDAEAGTRAGERGDTGAGTGGRALPALEGAPTVRGTSGPDPRLVATAERYAQQNGIELRRQAEFVQVDADRAARIAEAYEQMEHTPNDPAVREAFENLIQQTRAQYDALVEDGYKFHFIDMSTPEGQEYVSSPWNAMFDVRENQTMGVFPTAEGFGTDADFDVADNPMNALTGLEWPMGPDGEMKPVLANDLFRAVHDAFGHGLEFAGFRAIGEENAWQAHVRLFTGSAVAAITTETRGQNSWLNYGPHGETNRTAQVEDTIFADQKTGLMPEWTWTEGRAGDAPRVLQQGPRGQIEIPKVGVGEGTSVIRLFETADESTFLHETAHFFLEVMNDLNAPELAGDMEAIRNFVGAKDGQKGFTTEQHEKFARGFEAYLREGNAPSLAMADAFKLFKTWLTRIYSQVRNLDVKINDEMRGVFERMLASDAAIAEARAEQAMSPLFEKQPSGMDATAWKTYQRMVRRGVDQGEAELMTKVMAKLRREKEAWYKDERAAVAEQVEAEFAQRREFRLFEALANQRWIGNEQPETLDFRIDRAELVEQFGEAKVAQMGKAMLGGKRGVYAKDSGNSPSDVAKFFGFKSAQEMVDVVVAAGNPKAAVAAEVERRLTETYGDPFTDGTLEEEAMQAIHSEQQASSAVAEVRELTRQMGGNPTGMTSRLYAERAKDMLSRMTVAQASKPAQFLAAERRAAREAEQAFARVARGGDPEALSAARTAKERQVLNQHLYRQSLKIKEQVDKGRTKMMAYRKSSVREKLAGSYIEQIDSLLDAYDFRVKTPGQVQKVADLNVYIKEMTDAGREAELNIDTRLMENARRMHYSKLTVDELQGLFDTIANIDHMGRFKQKLIDRKRKRDLQTSADRVVQSIFDNNKRKRPTDDVPLVLNTLNLLAKPDTIFIRMDGGDEFGATWEEIKRGIDEASSVEQEMLAKMAEEVHELYKKHYNHKQLRAMQKAVSIPGLTYEWTKHEIIALAHNMGNKDNFQRVMDQNIAEERKLTPDQLDALLSTLDRNDWQFVQDHITMINGYWDGLAEVSKRRTGVTPKKVEAEVMYDGAPAFFTGGYYPIKYDTAFSDLAVADAETATDKYMTAGRGSTTQVGNGMTKERVATGGGRALKYDLSVSFAHMRETIRYTALSEAVDNSYRVLNHPDVKAAFRQTGNATTHETLNLWLQDTASGPIFNMDAPNRFFRALKNNFTMSRLSFNFKTVILQFTGVSQSMAVIGKRNMLKGMMLYYSRPKGAIADVLAMSPKMRERQTTMQKDIYDFANDVQMTSEFSNLYKKGKSQVSKWGFWPIVAMQFYTVDMPTWMGAYAKYIVEYDGDQQRASLAADKMVERAQDTGVQADRSAFERGTTSKTSRQSDVVRIFTTLGGYMLTKANRVYVRGLQGKQRIKQAETSTEALLAATNAAFDITLLLGMEAVMMGLMYEALDDDDDLEDMQAFMMKEAGSAVFGGIPLVRDAVGAFNGYGAGGVVGSALEAPYRLYQQTAQGENDPAFWRSVGNFAGLFTGLPTTATQRLLEASLDDDVPMSEALLGRNPLNYK
jgi:predicted ABC-type ATPase